MKFEVLKSLNVKTAVLCNMTLLSEMKLKLVTN